MARGGSAIWDLAAVALMVTEQGGSVRAYNGLELHLNRSEHVFFNDVGFVFTSSDIEVEALLRQHQMLSSAGETSEEADPP